MDKNLEKVNICKRRPPRQRRWLDVRPRPEQPFGRRLGPRRDGPEDDGTSGRRTHVFSSSSRLTVFANHVFRPVTTHDGRASLGTEPMHAFHLDLSRRGASRRNLLSLVRLPLCTHRALKSPLRRGNKLKILPLWSGCHCAPTEPSRVP